MSVEFEVDMTEFVATLQQYVKANKRESSDLITAKAREVAFFAAREVKVAKAADITKLGAPHKPRKQGSRARPRARTNTLFHALAAKGNKLGKAVRGQGNYDLATKIYNSRKKATSYSRALFLKMANQLKGKIYDFTKNQYAQGRSSMDGVKTKKSTPVTLEATLYVPGLDADHYAKEMKPALQRAINDSAKNMQQYLARKLQKVADKYSA
jgi:hypothetical protein